MKPSIEQAIKNGTLTNSELELIIEHLETNLEELFWVLDKQNNKLSNLQILDRLRSVDLEYLRRNDELEQEQKRKVSHPLRKIRLFIATKIDEVIVEIFTT